MLTKTRFNQPAYTWPAMISLLGLVIYFLRSYMIYMTGNKNNDSLVLSITATGLFLLLYLFLKVPWIYHPLQILIGKSPGYQQVVLMIFGLALGILAIVLSGIIPLIMIFILTPIISIVLPELKTFRNLLKDFRVILGILIAVSIVKGFTTTGITFLISYPIVVVCYHFYLNHMVHFIGSIYGIMFASWPIFSTTIIFAYLIGSIPFAWIAARLFTKDINQKPIDLRDYGSKITGTANAVKALGYKWLIPLIILEAGKGFLPVFIARQYFPLDIVLTIGFFAVLGHCFPIYLNFNRGKGITTALGVLLALGLYLPILLFIMVWIPTYYSKRIVSLGDILGLAIMPFAGLAYQQKGLSSVLFFLVFLSLLIIYRHAENISWLVKREETPIPSLISHLRLIDLNINLSQFFPKNKIVVIPKTILLILIGVYAANAKMNIHALWIIVLSSLLWATLYALNEASDLYFEKGISIDNKINWVLYSVIGIILIFSLTFSTLAFVLTLGMCLSQVFYSLWPRLKKFWWGGPLFSGIINTSLRIFIGASVGSLSYKVYWVNITAILMTFSGALTTRIKKIKHDQECGYSIAPNWLDHVSWIFGAIAIINIVILIWFNILPKTFIALVPFSIILVIYAKTRKTISETRQTWFLSLPIIIMAILLLVWQMLKY